MKYNVIYTDNPWKFDDKCHAGERGADYKYPTMTLEEICSMPVQDIADDNCALLLWIPWSMLFDAKIVMDAWGFQYKTIGFNWIKMNKISTDTVFWGMGSHTRNGSEPCLLGVKGKPKRISKSVHQVIHHPVMEHSRKPPIVRDKIVELYGDIPRVELFARERCAGWLSVGNALDNLDIFDSLNQIKKGTYDFNNIT